MAVSHGAAYLLARGLPGVVAFLAIPAFTRLLEPAAYGRYALVVSTAALLNALLFQWLRLSLVRYAAVYRDDAARLKSTLAAATGAMILITGIVAGALSLVVRGWREEILPCWALLATMSSFELCTEYARASIRPGHYMALQFTRTFVGVGLGVALVMLGSGWWGPVAGMAIGLALGTAYAGLRRDQSSRVRDWTDVRPVIDREVLARLARYGVPLSITVALAVVIGTSDRFLIAAMIGEGSAGLYSVAMDLTTQTLTLLMVSISMATFPLAVRAFETEGPAAARAQMRANVSLLLVVGVPALAGMAVLAPGIAHCVLGDEFRDAAAGLIPIVALGAFLAGLKAYHFDSAFQFAHQTIHQVWIVLVAAVLNIALNLVAIPKFGLLGAAGASVVAYAVSIALTVAMGRRHFALPFPGRTCLAVVVAGGAMAAALYPFRDAHAPGALAAQVVGGVAIYAALLVAFNVLGARDVLVGRMKSVENEDGELQIEDRAGSSAPSSIVSSSLSLRAEAHPPSSSSTAVLVETR